MSLEILRPYTDFIMNKIWRKIPYKTQIFFIIGLGFITFNYYMVYIALKPFQGFIISGKPIFYMVPIAFSTYLCFGIALLCGILFLLWKKDLRLDLILVSSAQVGVVLGAITIIVGMIWAKVEWGTFWDWNDRETITLVMWLIYVGLLIFRDMIEVENHERKATISAVFGIVAFVSVPLSYVIVGVLHPNPQQTSYSTGAGVFLMLNFLFIGILALILIYQAYKINKMDFALKKFRKQRMEED
ncbi:MAG: cytochrome c biogenesis protein [Candidatus Hodarchaeota archaeon]